MFGQYYDVAVLVFNILLGISSSLRLSAYDCIGALSQVSLCSARVASALPTFIDVAGRRYTLLELRDSFFPRQCRMEMPHAIVRLQPFTSRDFHIMIYFTCVKLLAPGVFCATRHVY